MKLFISKIYLYYTIFIGGLYGIYNTIVFTFKGFEQIYCIYIGKSICLIIMHY